jgi:hypothetical protein
MLQTHHQSQAMFRSVLHNVAATAAWNFHRGLAANRSATHRFGKRVSARSCLRLVTASHPAGFDRDGRLSRVGEAIGTTGCKYHEGTTS